MKTKPFERVVIHYQAKYYAALLEAKETYQENTMIQLSSIKIELEGSHAKLTILEPTREDCLFEFARLFGQMQKS